METSAPKYKKFLKHFHVGMRIIKSVIAIFLSAVITDLKDGNPVSSTIAAIIVMKQDTQSAMNVGIERLIGTFIGGVYSFLFLYAITFFEIPLFTILYYFFMSLLLIPVIKTCVLLKVPGSALNASFVVLVTLLSYITEYNKYQFVIDRMVDTMIGVVIAIAINRLLPAKKRRVKARINKRVIQEKNRKKQLESAIEEHNEITPEKKYSIIEAEYRPSDSNEHHMEIVEKIEENESTLEKIKEKLNNLTHTKNNIDNESTKNEKNKNC